LVTAEEKYKRREARYNSLLAKWGKAERWLGNLRLLVFLAGLSGAIVTYLAHNFVLMAAVLVLFAAVFFYLVARHEKLKAALECVTALRDINTNSLKRLKGEWNAFADTGADFLTDSHSYAADLDVFGPNSLFQWSNTAHTFMGRKKLSELFSGVVGKVDDIRQRQQAVEELAGMLAWRQRFLAEGMLKKSKFSDPQELIRWARESNESFRNPWFIRIVRVAPIITLYLVTAGLILNIIPWQWPVAALIAQFVFLSHNKKERYAMFGIAENYADDLRVYYKLIKLFEKRKFKNEYINKIKKEIKDRDGLEVFKQVDRLSSIIDSIADRRNLFYFFINILVLWDFQNIIALERWKQKAGPGLKKWFDALGKMEALASLAVIRFEHPDWVMPLIDDGDKPVVEAQEIGHPLLSEERVTNDFSIGGQVKVLLITGSNMSGKSTLLRTAGINLVLAYAGAPVCARRFRATIMEITSCMRVSDNLGKNISSFYAELLRIKEIVTAAESGKRVFFLLDEIFKGTNSLDRHTGARVLINKLSLTNAIGLVSTHDLELCDLERENKRIANYHFREYYENGRILFDYKLRPGPSTTRNALYLMQLAGINIEDPSLKKLD